MTTEPCESRPPLLAVAGDTAAAGDESSTAEPSADLTTEPREAPPLLAEAGGTAVPGDESRTAEPPREARPLMLAKTDGTTVAGDESSAAEPLADQITVPDEAGSPLLAKASSMAVGDGESGTADSLDVECAVRSCLQSADAAPLAMVVSERLETSPPPLAIGSGAAFELAADCDAVPSAWCGAEP